MAVWDLELDAMGQSLQWLTGETIQRVGLKKPSAGQKCHIKANSSEVACGALL